MPARKYKLTTAKIKELKKELAFLRTKGRSEISSRMEDIQRDIVEELEDPYADITEDLLYLEKRIKEIKDILKNVEEVREVGKNNIVTLGSKVKVGIETFENEYIIVDPIEADPLNGKISIESPVGKALLGARVGDTIEANVVGRKTQLRVLHIS